MFCKLAFAVKEVRDTGRTLRELTEISSSRKATLFAVVEVFENLMVNVVVAGSPVNNIFLHTAVPVPVLCAGIDIGVKIVPLILYSKVSSAALLAVVLFQRPKEILGSVKAKVFIGVTVKIADEFPGRYIFEPPDAPLYVLEAVVVRMSEAVPLNV